MSAETTTQSPAELAVAQRAAIEAQQQADAEQQRDEARTVYREYMLSVNPTSDDGYHGLMAADDLGHSTEDIDRHGEFIEKYRHNLALFAERAEHARAVSEHRTKYDEIEKKMRAELAAIAGKQRRAQAALTRAKNAERELKRMQSTPEAELFFPDQFTAPHKPETFASREEAMADLEEKRQTKK